MLGIGSKGKCTRCKEPFEIIDAPEVKELPPEPRQLTRTLERDESGRLLRIVEVASA